jgi:NAD-dependent deacetylase
MGEVSDLIERAAALLHAARFAVAFTGAGISTPSGIPDFRSQATGLWENVDPLKVASIYGFRHDPKAFYDWIYPLAKLTLAALPNPAHESLARLETANRLKAVITQNIDMLHTRAGSRTVFELHGHMRDATCIHCFKVFPAEPIIQKFLADHLVPRCTSCGSVLKPNVILFGEQLPVQEFLNAKEYCRKADLMLVVGSSLEVAPASDLPMLAARNGAKIILINKDTTYIDAQADVRIVGDAAIVLPQIVERLEALA